LFGARWGDHLSGAIPSAEHRRADEQHPDVRPDASSHDQPLNSSGVSLHRGTHHHAKTPESSVVDWPLQGKLNSLALPMPRGIERLTRSRSVIASRCLRCREQDRRKDERSVYLFSHREPKAPARFLHPRGQGHEARGVVGSGQRARRPRPRSGGRLAVI
jgi:hypothetical protein